MVFFLRELRTSSSTYSLKPQLDSAVLSIIVTTSYVTSSDFIHLTTECVSSYQPPPIPPPPSPRQPLFYCFYEFDIFLILHLSTTMQYLPLSVWLTSLSIMPSRFIHVVANGNVSMASTKDVCFLLTQEPGRSAAGRLPQGHTGTQVRFSLWSCHPPGAQRRRLDPLQQDGLTQEE